MNSKPWWKSRTLLLAFVTALAGIQEAVQPLKDIDPKSYGVLLVIIAVLVVILRAVTTTAITTDPSETK